MALSVIDMDETKEVLQARLEAVHAELVLAKRELADREQELGCIYTALDFAKRELDDTAPLETVFQQMVELVPLALMEVEPISARIIVSDQEFVTPGFCATPLRHTHDILVDCRSVGTIEVHCRDETASGTPLSRNKERFLANLAMHIGEILRRRLSASQQRAHTEALEVTNAELADKCREIEMQFEFIDRQRQTMVELAAPVLEVWRGVLVVPIAGVIHEELGIMEKVLAAIAEKQPRFVIVDLTGLVAMDTSSAVILFDTARAASLLGTTCMLTGIRPHIAQTIIELDINMSSIHTRRNLRDGLQECLRRMRNE